MKKQCLFARAWLGLLFILAEKEVNNIKLSDEHLLQEISFQWKEDLNFLPSKLVQTFRKDFEETLLADYLGNVAREASNTRGVEYKG